MLAKYLTLGSLKEVKNNIMKSVFIVNGIEINNH